MQAATKRMNGGRKDEEEKGEERKITRTGGFRGRRGGTREMNESYEAPEPLR